MARTWPSLWLGIILARVSPFAAPSAFIARVSGSQTPPSTFTFWICASPQIHVLNLSLPCLTPALYTCTHVCTHMPCSPHRLVTLRLPVHSMDSVQHKCTGHMQVSSFLYLPSLPAPRTPPQVEAISNRPTDRPTNRPETGFEMQAGHEAQV